MTRKYMFLFVCLFYSDFTYRALRLHERMKIHTTHTPLSVSVNKSGYVFVQVSLHSNFLCGTVYPHIQ